MKRFFIIFSFVFWITSSFSQACIIVNPISEHGNRLGQTDTICVGDYLRFWVEDSICPNWSPQTISWYLQGIDGPDSIHGANVTVLYPDTGFFVRIIYGAYTFTFDSSGLGGYGTLVLPCPPTAAFESNATKVCPNHCLQFSDKTNRTPIQWHWYFPGGLPSFYNGPTPPPICYSKAGKYNVSLAVQSKFGYDSITKLDYIEVVDPPIKKHVDSFFIVPYGNSISIDACATGSTYRWIPSVDGCVNCSTIIVSPSHLVEEYQCIVTNLEGCDDTCHYTIHTEGIVGNVFVPNAFSPNGDGNNDLFQVFGKNINLVRLQIFNRWGEKVFDSPDINTGWNGDYNGSPQEAGVYVYHLLFFSGIETDARQLKGSITLIR